MSLDQKSVRPLKVAVALLFGLLGADLSGAGEIGNRGPDQSLWSLSGSWQSDDGTSFSLTDLAGGPAVVAMFYTGCHVTCPVTVEAMAFVEHNLPPDLARRCRFVLVTLDPGGDTADELRAFRTEFVLSARWVLLRTSRRTTRVLAERLGIDFQVGLYRTSHTSSLAVVDASGRFVSIHSEVRPELRRLVAELVALDRATGSETTTNEHPHG